MRIIDIIGVALGSSIEGLVLVFGGGSTLSPGENAGWRFRRRGGFYLSRKLPQFVLLLAGIALCHARAQGPVADGFSVTTRDRMEDAGWWPTKGDAARSLYVGNDACKECHRVIAARQETTPMFHAGVRAAQSEILKTHGQLTFQEAGFNYSLTYAPGVVTYSVTNGAYSHAADVAWGFGAGKVGQTYVLMKSGAYIEGRVTYYSKLGSLDITPGHLTEPPVGLEEALGQPLDGVTARRCFGCHTTAAVTSRVFEPEKATPGVMCEACHGPGAKHVVAMKAQEDEESSATIMNPTYLSPSDSVDFCGACHRTWADVATEKGTYIGDTSVRFQPYRLEKSRCWKESGDARIACVACHDPHRPLVRESSAYISKCLACHSAKQESNGQKTASKTCTVGTSNCVSCHMPKVELPHVHATFTDHYIRVIRANGSDPGKLSP